MTIQDLFILNLKTHRKLRKISQMRLADLCDSSSGYIGEIESGKRFPSVAMIERIAAALEIESWHLFRNAPTNRADTEHAGGLAPSQKSEILKMADSALAKILEKF